MAVGFPTKVTYANGDVYSASDVNDSNGTLNLLNPTAKGSLVSASAANTPSRLAVGANDLLLTAASGETTGLKWSGAWTTWTPTWTNFTVGNAAITAKYCQIGKVVHAYIGVVLGTTSVMGIAPNFTLPVNAVTAGSNTAFGNLYIEDFAVAGFNGFIAFRNTTTAQIFAISANGTYLGGSNSITTTLPFTWGSGDIFNGYFWYEVA